MVYVYQCACGNAFEAVSTIEDRAHATCPGCHQLAGKVFLPAAIVAPGLPWESAEGIARPGGWDVWQESTGSDFANEWTPKFFPRTSPAYKTDIRQGPKRV